MLRDYYIEPNKYDWSINLPIQAIQKGYSLKGGCGTYDSLELLRKWETVRTFKWNKIPNIYEIEDIIKEIEEGR